MKEKDGLDKKTKGLVEAVRREKRSSTFDLMLCCHHFEILKIFEQGAPHFHFVLGLTNYAAGPSLGGSGGFSTRNGSSATTVERGDRAAGSVPSNGFFLCEAEKKKKSQSTLMSKRADRAKEVEISCMVEKSGRLHLNQVMKVTIVCNKRTQHHIPSHMMH